MQVAATRNLQQKLTENKRQLVPLLGGNLVDAVWGSAQPSAPTAAMRVHPQEYAGQAVPDKLKELLQQMEGDCLDSPACPDVFGLCVQTLMHRLEFLSSRPCLTSCAGACLHPQVSRIMPQQLFKKDRQVARFQFHSTIYLLLACPFESVNVIFTQLHST